MTSSVLAQDEHFLSTTNPAATADQRDLEVLALKVYEMPAVVKARQQVAARWKGCLARSVPEAAWTRFDGFLEDWCFSFVLKAVNSDANYPKVLGQLLGPPHEWFGRKVPGSRGAGGDNPDVNYVIVPIDPHAHFELSGRRFDPYPADAPFVVSGDPSLLSTLAILDWQDVQVDADGRFLITIGPDPAEVGNIRRPNHLQTKIDARYLFLRECRSDWRQIAGAYRVRRINAPTAPPLTLEQMADRAAHFMLTEVPAGYFSINMIHKLPLNSMVPPFNTGALGGLVTQMMSFGRISCTDDEAFVITTTPGGAAYRGLALCDPVWMLSLDCRSRSGTANDAQTIANDNGSTTYVVAKSDPGVANWLDPGDFDEVTLFYRWQGLPKPAAGMALPSLKSELVKLKDIDDVLPAGTKRVTSMQRKQQIAERMDAFDLRYVDR